MKQRPIREEICEGIDMFVFERRPFIPKFTEESGNIVRYKWIKKTKTHRRDKVVETCFIGDTDKIYKYRMEELWRRGCKG